MENFTAIEYFYLACAVIGGVMFLLRATLFFIGMGASHDVDGGFAGGDAHGDFSAADVHTDFNGADIHGVGAHDIDFQGDFHADGDAYFDADHGDTDLSFKFISLQGLTAFFMMFGLVGLALVQAEIATLLTIAGGTIAGAFTVWLLGRIFVFMLRLQSEGTLQIKNAIGVGGTVYLNIPAGGSGQVRAVVQGGLKIFDAVSADKKAIKTGKSVKVVDVTGDNTLIVELDQPQQ